MDWFKPHTPELVAEGVVYLCSRDCNASGELFRIGGGRFSRYGIFGNKGVADAGLTAEIVAERCEEGRDMGDAEIVPDAAYDMMRFNTALAADWQQELTSDRPD
jgi:hypothetical protein